MSDFDRDDNYIDVECVHQDEINVNGKQQDIPSSTVTRPLDSPVTFSFAFI